MDRAADSGIIAIIPARGGSKRLPGKNLLPVGGSPLLVHTVRQALAAHAVDQVYVSTDDDEIAACAAEAGAEVIVRPPALATDVATSEQALLHALDCRISAGLLDPDLVVFLQCTSPIRAGHDIDRAVARLQDSGADSLFSACRDTPFLWQRTSRGLQSVTYDYRARKRTQDGEPYYRENGSIYVFRPSVLREFDNRLGGKIELYEMPPWSSFDIDTEADLALVQSLFERGQVGPA